MTINLEALAQLVAAAGGKKAVAERARITRNTLDRLMRDRTVRKGNLEKVAKALGTTPDGLLADGADAARTERPRVAAARRHMRVLLEPTFCRNLDLVAQRYNVSENTILQAAPLMFAILAEESLRERKKHVSEMWAHAYALMSSDLKERFPVILYHAGRADRALDHEEKSIKARDLDGTMQDDYEPGEERSPFAGFLSKRLIDLGCTDPDEAGSMETTSYFVERQTVFEDEFEAIIKDDERARLALRWGFVRIADIPSDLQRVEGESDERANARRDWLASKFPDEEWERHEEHMRDLINKLARKESV